MHDRESNYSWNWPGPTAKCMLLAGLVAIQSLPILLLCSGAPVAQGYKST